MSGEEIKTEAGQQTKQTYGEPVASSTPTSFSYYDPQKEIEKLREQSKEDIGKVNYVLFGLVIFVVITFIVEIYTMNLDRIKDKDLYLRYNDLYQRYVDENVKLKDEINNQKIDFNNLKNQIELLRAKNSYLK